MALVIAMRKLVASGKTALAEKLALLVSFDCWLLAEFGYPLGYHDDLDARICSGALRICRLAHLPQQLVPKTTLLSILKIVCKLVLSYYWYSIFYC